MTRHQIVLRVPREVKRALRAKAKAEGLSINAYAQKVLARATGAKLTE